MMIRNENGFGAREILTISVVCLILSTILLVFALKTSQNEKYEVMERNARALGGSATTYQMENTSNRSVLMVELLDSGLFTKVKNPFDNKEYCNKYESKVEYQDGVKYVTLSCGEYAVFHQDVNATKYDIYKIGSWQLEKPSSSYQEVVGYNYKKDGINAYQEVYDANVFLYVFNKDNQTKYLDIESIPPEYGVFATTWYREKNLVKEGKSTKKEN